LSKRPPRRETYGERGAVRAAAQVKADSPRRVKKKLVRRSRGKSKRYSRLSSVVSSVPVSGLAGTDRRVAKAVPRVGRGETEPKGAAPDRVLRRRENAGALPALDGTDRWSTTRKLLAAGSGGTAGIERVPKKEYIGAMTRIRGSFRQDEGHPANGVQGQRTASDLYSTKAHQKNKIDGRRSRTEMDDRARIRSVDIGLQLDRGEKR